MAQVKRRPPTVEELRHGIDRGRAGDKVPFPDPAAAPLGSDDEAAGTPPTGVRRTTAVDQELGHGPARTPRPMGALWAMVLLIVLVIAAAWWGLAAR